MDKPKLVVLGVVVIALIATAGCVAPSPTPATNQAMAEQPGAVTDALKTQSTTAARPPLPPPVTPPQVRPPGPKFRVCLLGAQSCMALDPRPFVVCPAAGDSICDPTATLEPLETEQQPSPERR